MARTVFALRLQRSSGVTPGLELNIVVRNGPCNFQGVCSNLPFFGNCLTFRADVTKPHTSRSVTDEDVSKLILETEDALARR